jgi:hypothetical protein
MSEEAKRMSVDHQKWMIQCLKDNNGSATYETIVVEGEKHHCDTVGALLKILKGKKAIDYDGLFLMYPVHKNQVIKLTNPDFDPSK